MISLSKNVFIAVQHLPTQALMFAYVIFLL